MHLCIQSGAAALCVAVLLLLLQLQVVAAAVRHRVSDGNHCCWFIESDSSVFFLVIQTRFCILCFYSLDLRTRYTSSGV